MRNYEKFFEGCDVPVQLKKTAICIMRRFTILGICDGICATPLPLRADLEMGKALSRRNAD